MTNNGWCVDNYQLEWRLRAVLFYIPSLFLSENLPVLCMWLTWRYVCVRKHSVLVVLQPQLYTMMALYRLLH